MCQDLTCSVSNVVIIESLTNVTLILYSSLSTQLSRGRTSPCQLTILCTLKELERGIEHQAVLMTKRGGAEIYTVLYTVLATQSGNLLWMVALSRFQRCSRHYLLLRSGLSRPSLSRNTGSHFQPAAYMGALEPFTALGLPCDFSEIHSQL